MRFDKELQPWEPWTSDLPFMDPHDGATWIFRREQDLRMGRFLWSNDDLKTFQNGKFRLVMQKLDNSVDLGVIVGISRIGGISGSNSCGWWVTELDGEIFTFRAQNTIDVVAWSP